MIICALVVLFFATIVTGPACAEWRERRRREREALEDAPTARVIYLPTAACREQTEAARLAIEHRSSGCAMIGYCAICDAGDDV